MKDLRCKLGYHNKTIFHMTKLLSTRCLIMHFVWYECKRCDLKGINSGDNYGRTGKTEWKKDWSVAPYSSYADQLMRYKKREFQNIMNELENC